MRAAMLQNPVQQLRRSRLRYSYKAMYHVLAQHSPVAHGHQVRYLVVDGPYAQCSSDSKAFSKSFLNQLDGSVVNVFWSTW